MCRPIVERPTFIHAYVPTWCPRTLNDGQKQKIQFPGTAELSILQVKNETLEPVCEEQLTLRIGFLLFLSSIVS